MSLVSLLSLNWESPSFREVSSQHRPGADPGRYMDPVEVEANMGQFVKDLVVISVIAGITTGVLATLIVCWLVS